MAKPWHVVDSQLIDEGLLELRQRGERGFLLTIGGRVLMNSSGNLSEIALAQLACEPLAQAKAPRVLVGGLGMGFTLRAALDSLSDGACVVVAELNPIMVTWCRGPLARLTGTAVDDPRVHIEIGDVSEVIAAAAGQGGKHRFDAIMLDLYEGPYEGGQGALFGDAALARSRAALTASGVFAVWSEDPDRAFEKRLNVAGFAFSRQRPGRGGRHVVYVARKK